MPGEVRERALSGRCRQGSAWRSVEYQAREEGRARARFFLFCLCILRVLRVFCVFVHFVFFCAFCVHFVDLFVLGSRFFCAILSFPFLSLFFLAHLPPRGICSDTPCRHRCRCRYRCPTIHHAKCRPGDRGRIAYWSKNRDLRSFDLDVDSESRIVTRDLDLRKIGKIVVRIGNSISISNIAIGTLVLFSSMGRNRRALAAMYGCRPALLPVGFSRHIHNTDDGNRRSPRGIAYTRQHAR